MIPEWERNLICKHNMKLACWQVEGLGLQGLCATCTSFGFTFNFLLLRTREIRSKSNLKIRFMLPYIAFWWIQCLKNTRNALFYFWLYPFGILWFCAHQHKACRIKRTHLRLLKYWLWSVTSWWFRESNNLALSLVTFQFFTEMDHPNQNFLVRKYGYKSFL